MGLDSFATEAFTLLSVGISIVLFRTYARWKLVGFSGLEVDDYLMLFVIIPYATETALGYAVGASAKTLTNSGMTDEERAALSPDSDEYGWRVLGSKIQVAGWVMYVSVLWIIKASLLTFYVRLTAGLQGYRIRLIIGFVLVAATYIAVVLSILFGCTPMKKNWQIYPAPGNLCEPAMSNLNIFMTVTLNIITDIYLVFIPIPMLWATQLPTFKRVGLCVIFSGAIFVMTAGLLRCIMILQNPITGPRQGSAWAVRESFVAVATSSMPMIWAVVRRWLKRFFGSVLSSNKKTTGPEPGSIMLADRTNNSDWRKHRTQATVTATVVGKNTSNDDFTGFNDGDSEDDIIQKDRHIGGIRKDVEVTISTNWAERGGNEDLESGRGRAV
ncbi:hypothetical protein jhhlp_001684 [Lomentospora prolificans]|uniref:Rhodopsin domain-containing protein n=1 Tax=Lomentospora prolificans TaxID=41688 RepID=A0A2N3NGV1_9PEZI|nr:hypothetical protein jhhlp_001684 [Lomentospora prolificans]